MRLLKFLGGSAIAFYLVCLCAAVISIPVSADKCVDSGCDAAAQVVAGQPAAAALVVAENGDKIDAVLDKFPGWLKLAALVTSAFSVIAAATPTPKDDGVLLAVRKVVDWLSFNIGNAKPAVKSDNRLR